MLHSRNPVEPRFDGVEYTIIPNRSTAILAFIAAYGPAARRRQP
jgi:hypothetical protein